MTDAVQPTDTQMLDYMIQHEGGIDHHHEFGYSFWFGQGDWAEPGAGGYFPTGREAVAATMRAYPEGR